MCPWMPLNICLTSKGAWSSNSIQHWSMLLFSTYVPGEPNMAMHLCSSPGQSMMWSRSFRATHSFFAGNYSPMSRDMTVFLSGPTTCVLIAWAYMRTVSRVFHSWTGAAIKGGAPACVTGIASLTNEWYPDYTGTRAFWWTTLWLSSSDVS